MLGEELNKQIHEAAHFFSGIKWGYLTSVWT